MYRSIESELSSKPPCIPVHTSCILPRSVLYPHVLKLVYKKELIRVSCGWYDSNMLSMLVSLAFSYSLISKPWMLWNNLFWIRYSSPEEPFLSLTFYSGFQEILFQGFLMTNATIWMCGENQTWLSYQHNL